MLAEMSIRRPTAGSGSCPRLARMDNREGTLCFRSFCSSSLLATSLHMCFPVSVSPLYFFSWPPTSHIKTCNSKISSELLTYLPPPSSNNATSFLEDSTGCPSMWVNLGATDGSRRPCGRGAVLCSRRTDSCQQLTGVTMQQSRHHAVGHPLELLPAPGR